MPYPLTESDGKFCVNGKCYDKRDDALAYQRALEANVPDAKKEGHFADPKDNKLPISTPEEVADAITALSSGGFRRHKVTFDEGTKKAAIAAISKRIGELNISDDEKAHLRDRLSAVKSFTLTPRNPGFFSKIKSGVVVLKGRDGLRFMLMITTNNYKDRDHEIIAAKALQTYVDHAWRVEDKCLPDNPLLFWHRSDPIGDIVWTKMHNGFLLEVAKERSNRKIRIKGEKYIWETTVKTLWDVIEKDEKVKWGASHGFRYPDDEFKNGVYERIRKFESSTLPLPAAANLLTFSGVVKDMDTADKVLENLFSRAGILNSPDIVKRFLKGADDLKKGADKAGLESKAFEADKDQTKGIMDKVSTAIDAFFSKMSDAPVDPTMKTNFLHDLVDALTNGQPPSDNEDEDVMNYDSPPAPAQVDQSGQVVAGKEVKAWNAVIKALETLTEDNVSNREVLNQVVKAIEPLADLPATLKKHETAFSGFESRLKAVETKLSGMPRRGTEDTATVVTDAKLTEAAAKSLEGQKELFPGSGAYIRTTPGNGKGA